jgi:hypothetical protein
MKIRLVGSCSLRDPFKRGQTRAFDGVAEFLLLMDDYGDWKAALRGGAFQ